VATYVYILFFKMK